MPDEPLRTTTFTLTGADALAYEQAASRMTPLGVFALLCWLGLWGGMALLIPANWAGERFGMASAFLVSILVAIGYVLALLLIAIRQWLRARRHFRRAAEVTLTEWPDRLEMVGLGMPRTVGFAEIRRTVLGRNHLFLDTDEQPLILPRRAFPELGTVEDMARRIEATPPSAAAEPVDPGQPSA